MLGIWMIGKKSLSLFIISCIFQISLHEHVLLTQVLCNGWRSESWVGGSAGEEWSGQEELLVRLYRKCPHAGRDWRAQVEARALFSRGRISLASTMLSLSRRASKHHTFHKYIWGQWMNKQKRKNESDVSGEEGMDWGRALLQTTSLLNDAMGWGFYVKR